MSFFQRKEIKDILSYLRVIANFNDDVNLLRIINTPRRGIGKGTIQTVSDLARRNKTFFWDAMDRLFRFPSTGNFLTDNASSLPPKIRAEVEIFMNLIESSRERIFGSAGKGKLAEQVRNLVDHINYWPYLMAEFSKNEKIARWRFSNIEYFIQAIENWEKDPDNFDTGLYAWLHRVSLITSSDDKEDEKGKVNLMTIHAAKGLEFPVVFIAGAEEGIIPHTRSLEDAGTDEPAALLGPMEEERRLFYVAITRAREKLYITSCKQRRRLQDVIESAPSPFLTEIPLHLITTTDVSKPVNDPVEADAFFARIKERFK
jgi:DNA helicase-2/ATP-dependent DNA helicase PcrA